MTPQPAFRDYIAERTHVTWTRAPDTWCYPFQPTLSAEEKEGATPERDGALDRGDPEGDRGRQSLTAPRWGGLLLAKIVSPLSVMRFPLRTARVRISDLQPPLFDLG